jgi:hypothetical protein
LLTDRHVDAHKYVSDAWAHRSEALSYVIPRILWFQIALALLENLDPLPQLSRLKTALQNDSAFMEWTMEPVLDKLKQNLSSDNHTLLSAIVAAMSNRAVSRRLSSLPSGVKSKHYHWIRYAL